MKLGLIKPSSNVTMEHELPIFMPGISIHSVGLELHSVTPESLLSMNTDVPEAARTCASYDVSLIVSACLVATMLSPGGHQATERDIKATSGLDAISSAGALVRQLINNGYKRIAVIAPYSDTLMGKVIEYFHKNGLEVVAHRNFGIVDNTAVANIQVESIVAAAKELDLSNAEVLVVSACVQMPSVAALHNDELLAFSIPIMSASSATAVEILNFYKNR